MSDHTYFLIEPGSPVLEVIAEAKEMHRAYLATVEAFAAEFGTKRWYATTKWQVYVLGLAFDGPPPRGWRENKSKGYSRPDLRTPEGRAIAPRMKALPNGVSASKFGSMLDERFEAIAADPQRSYTAWDGCAVSWTGYEILGEHTLLCVPAACKVSPPGCRGLKMSEYWQLKEAAETAVPA
jgi:hypothetical protein